MWRDADPARWSALLRPYEAFVRLLRRRAADATLCIATAKDRASVDVLLAHYGVADLFAADCIFDKQHGRTKRAHLSALREHLGVDFSEITFVDDKFNHLLDASRLGVRCALAAWGYNGARELAQAREAGHKVCTLADAEVQLFGPSA
jgi:phosphoglycolate phosphatase-like HAD superfamily hydrolase